MNRLTSVLQHRERPDSKSSFAVAIAVLVSVTTSCAGSDKPTTTSRVKTCPGSRSTPVTPTLLQSTLQAHGFSAKLVSRSCRSRSATVANASPTAQGSEEHRADREGFIICDVRHRPFNGRMAKRPYRLYAYATLPTNSTPGRQFLLANVDCSLYLTSTTRAKASTELRHSLEAVQRQIVGK